MFKSGFLNVILITALFAANASAQEYREESSLNYVYTGPIISYSSNSAEYSDWINGQQSKVKLSGTTYSGGLDMIILSGNMCGDFQARYSYSSYESTLTCLEFLFAGKYFYDINNYISLGGGLGLYMETPPSSSGHNGSAGFFLPLSIMFNTTDDTKLLIDFFGKYGTFGLGDNTEFSAFGCSIGFVLKVGRI